VLCASERSERSAEKLIVRNCLYAELMAYVPERKSALPDAKPEPEMG